MNTINQPLTPRLQRVLMYAKTAADERNHEYVGVEHLMLALAREENGAHADALKSLGITAEQLRDATLPHVAPMGPALCCTPRKPTPPDIVVIREGDTKAK